MSETQNQHLAFRISEGTVEVSSGVADADKVIKTDAVGKIDLSLFDLSTVGISTIETRYPENILFSDDGSDNDVTIQREFDYTNKKAFISAIGNSNDQDVNLVASFIIPDSFDSWITDAVVIYVRTSSATVTSSTFDVEVYRNGINIHNVNDVGSSVAWTSFTISSSNLQTPVGGDEYSFVIHAKMDDTEFCQINRVEFQYNKEANA